MTKKIVVSAIAGLASVGLVVGCGSPSSIGVPTNTSNTGNSIAVSTTPSNNSTSNDTSSSTKRISDTTTPVKTLETSFTYKSYTNNRFGFTVEYPSTWSESPSATDGDGRSFTTPSSAPSFDNGSHNSPNQVTLTAVGTNDGSSTFAQLVHQATKYVRELKNQKGIWAVSYKIVPNKWVWVQYSMKTGHNATYIQRQWETLTTAQTVSLVYPKNEVSVYKPIWNHIVGTFKPADK